MNRTSTLEEVVNRFTSEQKSRLLSFAELLAAETSPPDVRRANSFSEPLRRRLRLLTRKSEAETLTDAERAEYIAFAERLENHDAARLNAAAELSKSNNLPLTAALTGLDTENTNGNG